MRGYSQSYRLSHANPDNARLTAGERIEVLEILTDMKFEFAQLVARTRKLDQ
jgi:hypothetical protein